MEQPQISQRISTQLQSRLSSRRGSDSIEKSLVATHKAKVKPTTSTKVALRHINVPLTTPASKSAVTTPKGEAPPAFHKQSSTKESAASPGSTISKKSIETTASPVGKPVSPISGQAPVTSKSVKTPNVKVGPTPANKINNSNSANANASKNPFSNEKPYSSKKRTLVGNLVRNIIQNDVGGRSGSSPYLASAVKSIKKTPSQEIRLILGSGQNPKESLPREPKSEACTPKNRNAIARIFSARKQSHGTLKAESGNNMHSLSKKETTATAVIKLPIKGMNMKRTPSLVPVDSSNDKPLGLGSRRTSKNSDIAEDLSKVKPLHGTVVCVGGSTSEYSTSSGSFVRFNDGISQERDKIIQLNKLCNICS